jgi:hypothetical protein
VARAAARADRSDSSAILRCAWTPVEHAEHKKIKTAAGRSSAHAAVTLGYPIKAERQLCSADWPVFE